MTYPIIPLLTILMSTTLTPGPNNIMGMTLGQTSGYKKTFRYMQGMFLGGFVHRIILALFSGAIFEFFPSFITVVAVIGAIYFVYMAVMMIRASSSPKPVTPIEDNKLFVSGFFLQFINPKSIATALAIMASFLFPYVNEMAYGERLIYIALFALLLSFTAFFGILVWMLSGMALSAIITKHRKTFNYIMAILFIYCAVSILQPVI